MFNFVKNSDNYAIWLTKLVGDSKNRSMVLQTMLDVEFYSDVHDFDKNRMSDAIFLRRSYMQEKNISNDDFYEAPPTVLETLIGLITRIENDILSEDDGISSEDMFEMFLENLSIDFVFDWDWDANRESYVRQQINNFLDRRYNRDGSNGNIFVLKECPDNFDFRKKDIWSQAQWWLREKIM